MAAWLEHLNAKHRIEDETFVGRHKDNQICLTATGVSRRHALVYFHSSACFISDLGSTNGVLINGTRIWQPTLLTDKDEIRLGEAVLRFRWPGQRALPPQESALSTTAQTAVVAPGLGAVSRLVLRVDENLRIRDADAAWQELVKRFFHEPSDPYTSMPSRLHAWLRTTTAAMTQDRTHAAPFVAQHEGSRLVLRCIRASAGEYFLLCTMETAIFSSLMLMVLGLSEREVDVMKWLAEGKTNGEIADILSIAVGTVNKHVESILKKLGVENRAQAIREVIERVGRG